MLSTNISWYEVSITLLGPLQDLSRIATFDWSSVVLTWYCLNSFVLIGFFFSNWLWMFMLIALSFSAVWLWISLPNWLLIHYLHCWWWFECIFSWRLVEVSSNVMIVQKVHWIWANSLIIHEIVCIQQISLTSIFLTIVYLPFAKSEASFNHHMLRAYYLPSEELSSTLKFGENLLEKNCEHWA